MLFLHQGTSLRIRTKSIQRARESGERMKEDEGLSQREHAVCVQAVDTHSCVMVASRKGRGAGDGGPSGG